MADEPKSTKPKSAKPKSPDWLPLTNAPYTLIRKYDFTLERAVEFLADALLRHPEFALTCCVYKVQTKKTEFVPRVGEIRTRALEKFRHCAETGRIKFEADLYIDRNELTALCEAEKLVIPPMFYSHVRLCPAEPDIPLSDAARTQIREGLRLFGHELAPDVEARLLAGVENAANYYLRAQILNYGLPDKPTASKYAKRLETAAGKLRDLLTDMQIPERGDAAMYSEFRKLLDAWGINHFDFQQSLARVAAAAEELRLRVKERMRANRPTDEAARQLAREIALAMADAGIRPTTTETGLFENCILPAVFEFVGAKTGGAHKLVRLGVAYVTDQ